MHAGTDIVLDMARRAGRLTEEELARITTRQQELAAEQERAPSAAEVAVSLELLTDEECCEWMVAEFALPRVSLTGRAVAGEVLGLLEGEQARRYDALPIELRDDTLVLGMADPLDVDAIDDLAALTGRLVEPVLVARGELRAALDRFYGSAEEPEISVEMVAGGDGADGELAGTESGAEDAPIIRRLRGIISDASRRRASDVHLEPLERRFRVRYRIDGRLLEVEGLPKRLQLPLISRAKIMAGMSIAEKRLPQDGRIQHRVDGRTIDLRVSSVPTAHGESIVMRLLDTEGLNPDLAELGLLSEDEAQLRRFVGQSDGMVLVTGPTGSGKTTTLYSCLHAINRPDRKIITVEDPVEYQLSGVNQVPVRSEVGLSFAAALRAMLRQAPNVVMVGEVRDRETAEIAINASLTGHLVFSTLHTNDAPGAVTRLIDLGVKPFLIASALRAVVAQRLVRRVCEGCAEVEAPSEMARALFADAGLDAMGTPQCRRGKGCADCNQTGYRGRLAIFEFFVVNETIERMIHDHVDLPTLRSAALAAGMRSLRMDGLRKVQLGLTTLDEILAATVSEDSA
ncbi:GspE/PulE family protein [Actomonas aquatica]|uniref:GspE/PulE family protein n=1 Tax=Actomonas aquatica TaxID=2866162 RepID=A0ABZ1C960_9BACT|nr:GspE/PulE family protein [Opitutus sp. WL0086]WRQ88041.1 GspE/PulE family protein [Opitutus sp. WL0086]